MDPLYKVTYFQMMGLAEPLRFLLKYGGIDFEDERIDRADWPEIKPSKPFGQVPVLTIDGKQYHQSIPLARYIAKNVKLTGNDDLEDLEIDAMVNTVDDLRAKLARYHYEKDAVIKESLKKPLFEEYVPFYLERLDKAAKENNGYLVCRKLTWADVFFAGLLDYMNAMAQIDLTAKYPNLRNVEGNVKSIPNIRAWIATRPKCDF